MFLSSLSFFFFDRKIYWPSDSLLFALDLLLFSFLSDCIFFPLFIFYFTILYWFCHTLTWIHHGCTCVPHPEPPLLPPSAYHPSGSSQCTSRKHPVSCIEPGLAIRLLYDIIHVSMPFSQIIPPSPYPTESKRLFYTSVSLLLSLIQSEVSQKEKHQYSILRHIYGI